MLITKKLLSKYSILPRNFNYDDVMLYVDVAEKIWLEPIIGTLWYDELLEQVSTNSLSDENSTALVEAIYPYLGFAVVYEALPLLWGNISEVGIVKGKSENSDSLSLKELTLIQDHIMRQLQARKEYLIKWLCTYSNNFPKLGGCCVQDSGNTDPKMQLYSTRRINTEIR